MTNKELYDNLNNLDKHTRDIWIERDGNLSRVTSMETRSNNMLVLISTDETIKGV